MATAIIFSTSIFAQILQGPTSGWPTEPCGSGPTTALKAVQDANYYYVSTTYSGVYRIAKSGFTSNSWTVYNGSGSLPPGGTWPSGTCAGQYFWDIYDLAISGNYLYALVGTTTSTSEKVYRCDLSTGLWSDVSPSPALAVAGQYLLGARGSYVFVIQRGNSSGYDIRYSQNTAPTAWSSLTLNPSSTTPSYVTAFNFVWLSSASRWDMNICASNGLFIKGLASTGAPTGGQGINTSLAGAPSIEYLYNSSGVFTWAYLTQNVTYSPGHYAPGNLIRIASGSSTPSSVTQTPASVTTAGNYISALACFGNKPHFAISPMGGGSPVSSPLFTGDVNSNNFAVSGCGMSSGSTVGVNSMLEDGTTRELLCLQSGGVWYYANTACKTDETTGIDEVDEEHIRISPNPATTQVTLKYYAGEDHEPGVKVYDTQGREQNVFVNFSKAGEATIDVSGLSTGVYLLDYQGTNRLTERLVIK